MGEGNLEQTLAIFYSNEKWLWAPIMLRNKWDVFDEKVHSFSLSSFHSKNQIFPRFKLAKYFYFFFFNFSSNDFVYRRCTSKNGIPLRSHTMWKQTSTGVDLIAAMEEILSRFIPSE